MRVIETPSCNINPEWIAGLPFPVCTAWVDSRTGKISVGRVRSSRVSRPRLSPANLEPSGETEEQASEQNQVKTAYAAERVVLTAGNVSVLDVFDAMDYSRDARTQFMNWASLTSGAWDYPADARGYTWGVCPRIHLARLACPCRAFPRTCRVEWFAAGRALLDRYGDAAEFELPYKLGGHNAIARALVFHNRVNAGAYRDAIAISSPPSVADVRRTQSKDGFGLSTQVEVTDDIGAFFWRAGWSDGRTETFMFTEIDRSLSVGALVKGTGWGGPKINSASRATSMDYRPRIAITSRAADSAFSSATDS